MGSHQQPQNPFSSRPAAPRHTRSSHQMGPTPGPIKRPTFMQRILYSFMLGGALVTLISCVSPSSNRATKHSKTDLQPRIGGGVRSKSKLLSDPKRIEKMGGTQDGLIAPNPQELSDGDQSDNGGEDEGEDMELQKPPPNKLIVAAKEQVKKDHEEIEASLKNLYFGRQKVNDTAAGERTSVRNVTVDEVYIAKLKKGAKDPAKAHVDQQIEEVHNEVQKGVPSPNNTSSINFTQGLESVVLSSLNQPAKNASDELKLQYDSTNKTLLPSGHPDIAINSAQSTAQLSTAS